MKNTPRKKDCSRPLGEKTDKRKRKYKNRKESSNKRHHESDLSNQESEQIKDLFEDQNGAGRKRSHDLRQVLNGILYLLRTGCQWEYIPHYYPPWCVCRYYFDKWTNDGTIEAINDTLVNRLRVQEVRKRYKKYGIIYIQNKPTTEAGGERGFDGGKRVKGRKRFILVDCNGNVFMYCYCKKESRFYVIIIFLK